MLCASTSTYPENLGSVGLYTPRGDTGPSLSFLFFCLFFVRHAPARSTVYGHQQGKHGRG